jgi:MFS family permease
MTAGADDCARSERVVTPDPSTRFRGLGSQFRLLWAGQTTSLIGDQITLLALPLLAITSADASALEVGLVATCMRLPFLLIGLQAGVWVTRYGLGPSMLLADVVRGVAIAVLPLVVLLGGINLPVILTAALVVGIGSVFFQVAYQSFVPEIVKHPRDWHAANTRLSLSESMSLLVGPAVGGVLVLTLSIAGALSVDAGSYVVSVLTLLVITGTPRRARGRAKKPRPRSESVDRMWHQVVEGLRYVRSQPVLSAIMWTGVTYNLGAAMFESLLVLFAVRDLGLSPAALGVAMGIGGVGFPVGSLLSPYVNRRIGMGPALIIAAVPSVGGFLLAAMAMGPVPQLYLAVGIGLVGVGQGCFAVNAITLRQQASAPHMRARTTAVHRFATWGTLPVGALLGGVVGELVGIRAALVLAFALAAVCFWPLLVSPLRHTRALEPTDGQLGG